jgi:hypothetical protein
MLDITPRTISEKIRASVIKIAEIIILLVCMLILASCNILGGTTSTNGSDIIEKLQKEVPFTIIVPAYLPADISPYPTEFFGPSNGVTSDNSVGVGFTYNKHGSNTEFIHIDEESGQVTFHPSRPSSLLLDVGVFRYLKKKQR